MKTEIELDMFSLYLKLEVVKKKRLYKVRDKVKIVNSPPKGSAFAPYADSPKETEMGYWLGKTMTIVQVQDRCYIMKEDNGRWAWTNNLIECKVRKGGNYNE